MSCVSLLKIGVLANFLVLFPGIFKAVSHNFFACEWSRDQVLQRIFVVFGEYALLKAY